jgi:cytosine/adenosine deaminase-related metal-dependent hydrolase
MLGPGEWIEDGLITVVGDQVKGVERYPKAGRNRGAVNHGTGVIMPALVNAHTHLTLSALAGNVPYGDGFLGWIQHLMKARRTLKKEEAVKAAETAACRMAEAGVGLAGEFGPYFPIAALMADAGLAGTVWLEFFGNRRRLPELPEGAGEVRFSYAGHAPNTVNPGLLKHIKHEDAKRGLLYCLHLAESVEETVFLETGKGAWADFLRGLGMDVSNWKCWGKRPVELAAELGLLDEATLAVHLLQVAPEDMATLAESGVNVCLCPRSNLNLHGKLPDIEGFLSAGMAPALGTDSLASCDSLSIFHEMKFVGERFPGLRPDDILAMGTINGARALGRPDLGRVRTGATARLIYVDMAAGSGEEAAERLVHEPPERVEWL